MNFSAGHPICIKTDADPDDDGVADTDPDYYADVYTDAFTDDQQMT